MTDPRRTVRVLAVDDAETLWGAQVFLLNHVASLAEHGIEVVLGAPPETELAKQWQSQGLPFQAIALPLDRSVRVEGGHGRLSPRAMARESARLVQSTVRIAGAARATSSDVIWANAHSVHLECALAGRLARTPALIQLHEGAPYLFGRLVRGAAVMLGGKTVAVSKAVFANLPLRVTRGIEVIPNGIDVEAFRPMTAKAAVRTSLGAQPDDVLIVVLARLDPVKRILDLVRAAAALPTEPSWRITFVGTTSVFPDYAESARQLAAELLGTRAAFVGRRHDTVDVLNAADVLAHAGEIEGTPLVVLEAQACEKPVVAYAMGGVPESVIDGESALLARPLDVDHLAAQLAEVIGDERRRREMGKAGRKYVEEHHRIESQVERSAIALRRLARANV